MRDNRPVVLVVMDGVGKSMTGIGDAVGSANTPTLDMLYQVAPHTYIKAHGVAVGLPSDDDMGNSEVGHNAIGCGQIYSQGAKLVNENIESKEIFLSDTWKNLINNCVINNSKLHFIGLLSDGNVHSNIAHLFSMIRQAKEENIHEVRIHILLDGRDVPATSALTYVEALEDVLRELNDDKFVAKIASGGGRMKITMDRYGANWNMVKQGYDTHVHGIGRQFATAVEAIETYRKENPGIIDQDLPAFVIASKEGVPVGKIGDNDSVILFNFRGDRAQEISQAFDDEKFDKFDRGIAPKVRYAGMLQYDGDLQIPRNFLVSPPQIKHTLTEYLVSQNKKSFAVSETQKYGHVTYFWNGNRSGKLNEELETFLEIPSDTVPFDERPWMKSAEVTDAVISAIKSGKYDFIRCNYPNGDMVGHTGNFSATKIAVEAVDLGLTRILPVIKEYNAILIITADHGNADEMLEKNKKGELTSRTAHSLNKVPLIIYNAENINIKDKEFGLSNIAATVTKLMKLDGYDVWDEPVF